MRSEIVKSSGGSSGEVICKIPVKLPSLNDYIRACRANKFAGSQMKKKVESEIGVFIARLPRFERPVEIGFHWVEENRRRDLDNVAFAKKFVLDALVKSGKLPDDDRRHVTAFSDSFEIGVHAGVILTIKEVRDEHETDGGDPDLGNEGRGE